MNTPSTAHICSALTRLFLVALVPIAVAGCSGLFDDLDDYEFDSPDESNQSDNQTVNQTNNQPDNQTDNQTDQCPSGETDCDGNCVDTDDDSAQCSGECIDTDNDRNNCGDCGTSCADIEDCENGSCVRVCDPEAEFDWITGLDVNDYQFGGGSGAEDGDPFLICSAQQLVDIGYPGAISSYPWMDAEFVLRADIDMSEITDFGGLGNPDKGFSGTFDGNGHKISNLTIDEANNSSAGLFRVLKDATVEDLVLEEFEITAQEGTIAGTLAGEALNSSILNIEVNEAKVTVPEHGGGLVGKITETEENNTITDITLDGIEVTATETADSGEPRRFFGGAVGRLAGSLSDVTASNIDITGDRAVGGLVGIAGATGDISTIAANKVSLTTASSLEETEPFNDFGGLVGRNRGSISQAAITSMSFSSPPDSGPSADDFFIENLGGLVGNNQNSATIDKSWADVDIELPYGQNLGGLVGRNRGRIENSFAQGTITSSNGSGVGGLVGTLVSNPYTNSSESPEIIAAYATTSVQGNDEIGGLVGRTAYGPSEGENTDESAEIRQSYAAGPVSISTSQPFTYFGGFLGNDLDPAVDIANSYWDKDTTNPETDVDFDGTAAGDDPEGLEELRTDNFEEEDSFDGWDFGGTWVIDTAPDGNSRPIFQWQSSAP